MRFTGYPAFLFVPTATPEQVAYRLQRQVRLDRYRGVVKQQIGTRFGCTELGLFTASIDALAAIARELEGPGRFAGTFVGPWRICYRVLESLGSDVKVREAATLVECFDNITLSTALRRSEVATPTVLWAGLADVAEADVLSLFRRISAATGNEPYATGEEYIDIHLGDDDSTCGVAYIRKSRLLNVVGESVALLSACLDSLGIVEILGEGRWHCARRAIIAEDSHPAGKFSGTGVISESPVRLDEVLRRLAEQEQHGQERHGG